MLSSRSLVIAFEILRQVARVIQEIVVHVQSIGYATKATERFQAAYDVHLDSVLSTLELSSAVGPF